MTNKIDERRLAARAAVRIHEHLIGPARRVCLHHYPAALWEELQGTITRLQLTERRGWKLASQLVLRDVDYATRRLGRALDTFLTTLPEETSSRVMATPGEIAADLSALAQEFDECRIDLRERTITVYTDRIVLEDTDLGAFRIVLPWDQIGTGKPYTVRAVEPNAAEGEDGVTHPHVRDRQLCEGEGTTPIRAALSTGRLLDFFILVRQVLETYNPESAHVALSHWGGASCRECGWRMPSDEGSTCERCGGAVCSECSTSCSACDCITCSGCLQACTDCGDYFCYQCLGTASGSSNPLCHTCLEKKAETHESEEESASESPAEQQLEIPAPAIPADDAVCLGEVTVPARPRSDRSRRVRRVGRQQPAARRRRATHQASV